MTINLTHLNPKQAEAVRHQKGPLLVLAGAGSGKTRVITYRIAYLIREYGVKAEKIMALTFTNKAAKEMKERLKSIIGNEASLCQVSTFHSFAVKFLREHCQLLQYHPHFAILDESDQESLIKSCLQMTPYAEEKPDISQLQSMISRYKNSGERLEFSDGILSQIFDSIYPLYNQRLKANNCFDFDDLLLKSIDILKEHEAVRIKTAQRYSYVLVDEYQDTNHIQNQMLELIARENRNLCVVGDDDQSIYSWRGAVFDQILHFETQWSAAKTIQLTQNYRSTNTILQAANAVIENNPERFKKKLWSELGNGECITFHLAENEVAESEWISAQIHRLVKQEEKDYRDIAILFRRNILSRPIEEALRLAEIPYRVFGAYRFFDRREIRDIIAFMRFLLNTRDELALERIINIPQRGIGSGTWQKCREIAERNSESIFHIMGRILQSSEIQSERKYEISQFHHLIQQTISDLKRGNYPEVFQRFLEELLYQKHLQSSSKTEQEYRQKSENVSSFIQSIFDFHERNPKSNLSDFYEKIILSQEEKDDEERSRVTLMSVHASKGLEFKYVFICGVEEGMFPSRQSIEETQDVSEERRLAYVGITRAQIKLFLTACDTRKRFRETLNTTLSRFLFEIPDALFDYPPSKIRDENLIQAKKDDAATHFFKFFEGLKK